MKKIIIFCLILICFSTVFAATKSLGPNTSCNNFVLTIKNNTSDDIRVHYIVPGDGVVLKPYEYAKSRNIEKDVEINKGETQEIVTVVNPPKKTTWGWYESMDEMKTDSKHDNTWIRVTVYAKGEGGKETLKFDKVIKKDVGKWKRYPAYYPYQPDEDGQCTLGPSIRDGHNNDLEVYKVLPGMIEFDKTFSSPMIDQPYQGTLLPDPPVRVFANRCVFAEGECGPAISIISDWLEEETAAPVTDYQGVVTLELTD